MRNSNKRGFTLIEIMVVILVILVLSGMLLKLSGIIRDRSQTAQATADLQNIQHALNEYYAEYGIYPPTSETTYVYEDASKQPPSLRDSEAPITADDIGYKYGLYAHLYERNMPVEYTDELGEKHDAQKRDYNRDTERDVNAKKRWAHYLKDVGTTGGSQAKSSDFGGDLQTYTNASITISDPWGKEYKYESHDPYQDYRLWSFGPDKGNGTTDDITN